MNCDDVEQYLKTRRENLYFFLCGLAFLREDNKNSGAPGAFSPVTEMGAVFNFTVIFRLIRFFRFVVF